MTNRQLSTNHWLDLPAKEHHKEGRKKWNPNNVFAAFREYSDHEAGEVCQEMLTSVSNEFNYYRDVSWLNMQMYKTTLSEWMAAMRDPNTPVDELAIFALSCL